MKRILFFFGVLATVAVGQAYANNANAKLVELVAGVAGSTTTGTTPTCNIPNVPCNRISGDPCNIGPDQQDLFAPDSEGLCNVQLFRD